MEPSGRLPDAKEKQSLLATLFVARREIFVLTPANESHWQERSGEITCEAPYELNRRSCEQQRSPSGPQQPACHR